MYVEENKPLARFTTFDIGGPARWFVEAANEVDVADAAAWAKAKSLPLFVLGGGSNLLVADSGFDGLVLHIGIKGITTYNESDGALYAVGAGEEWDQFVQQAVNAGSAGIECLSGIPGTVGGTPVQNVGAYGQEVASSIAHVRAYDLGEERFVDFSTAECGFGYRRSRFNSSDPGRFVVTRVDYRLTPGGSPTLHYADLQREFAGVPDPSLAQVAAAVRRIRRSKSMLLVEGDPDGRSAGSFFKNPVVHDELVEQIASIAGKQPPRFPAGREDQQVGWVKVPAAWLIEQAGFSKGFARGSAAISSRHTLALINRGGAKAADILALADEITAAVASRFAIRLEREPVLLGFKS
ncbi:MAG TPA: UDP-N-acetylmuramate dehydrogenase [Terracidiphilus sp.]|nr:UDP-N-acetylmuramate dehydrogenase [Terracidiphilus sp.]